MAVRNSVDPQSYQGVSRLRPIHLHVLDSPTTPTWANCTDCRYMGLGPPEKSRMCTYSPDEPWAVLAMSQLISTAVTSSLTPSMTMVSSSQSFCHAANA
jgi:hypothetical protein